MLNDLITAIEKYNCLQEDETKQLHWWRDAMAKIHCITDEKEVKAVLDEINGKIEKLKERKSRD